MPLTGREARSSEPQCGLCEDYPPEFDRALAALDYTAPWSAIIGRFKFNGAPALAKPLAGLLAQCWMAPSQGPRPDLLVPVPLSRQRFTERGYNQAWLLAKALSAETGIPARPDVVQRPVHTPRLMSLDADERRMRIRNAFHVPPRQQHRIEGQHIAVIDDVMTTGATLDEITRSLHDAGATGVSVWVVARTPHRGDAPKREPRRTPINIAP